MEVAQLQAVGHVHVGHIDRRDEAPRAEGPPGQAGVLDGEVAGRAQGPLLPAAAREPRAAVGDGGWGARDGGRHAAPPALPPPLRAERRVDPRAAGGGRERADAPHDVPGGDAAPVVGARPRARRAGRLLQRLLRRLPRLPQVRAPLRRLPRGGGRELVHRVPQGPRGRQDRQHAGAGHRHRLLAPPRRRHAQGRRHRHPRRRGAPPRSQPFRIGHPTTGDEAEGDACAYRVSLIINVRCLLSASPLLIYCYYMRIVLPSIWDKFVLFYSYVNN